MYVGGCEKKGSEAFGRDMGIIKETDIPQMLVEIGRAVTAAGMDYEAWIKEYESELEEIVKKYV